MYGVKFILSNVLFLLFSAGVLSGCVKNSGDANNGDPQIAVDNTTIAADCLTDPNSVACENQRLQEQCASSANQNSVECQTLQTRQQQCTSNPGLNQCQGIFANSNGTFGNGQGTISSICSSPQNCPAGVSVYPNYNSGTPFGVSIVQDGTNFCHCPNGGTPFFDEYSNLICITTEIQVRQGVRIGWSLFKKNVDGSPRTYWMPYTEFSQVNVGHSPLCQNGQIQQLCTVGAINSCGSPNLVCLQIRTAAQLPVNTGVCGRAYN